jgi:hypothetical protein
MKITRAQLRRVIREEYIRSTPATRPGTIMTEARANLLAEQMVDEGLFDAIKAGFAGLKAGAGKSAEKIGDAASKALEPAAKAVQQVAASAKTAAGNVSKAIGAITDDVVKAAAEAALKSLQDSLQATLKKELSTGLQNLVKAGMEEPQAKALISTMASSEIASMVGSGSGE